MSASLYLCLITLLRSQLVSSFLGSSPKIDCNDGQFYIRPDPENCSNFYKCDNGNPVLFHCGSGLYFNPEIHVCDWPRNVHCKIVNGASQQSNYAGQQYNGNNQSPDYADHNNAGQQSNGNNGEQYNSVDGGQQYNDNTNNQGGTGYEQGSDFLYPVQPVQEQPSDTSVGPSVQQPLGPLDRPRPTIDQLVEANGNPYQDYLNQNQNNIDIR